MRGWVFLPALAGCSGACEGCLARRAQYEQAAESRRMGKEAELTSEIERSQEALNQVQ